jgi:glucosyl-3-phosphoglycerate synthase
MADFQQNGRMTTLHNLGPDNWLSLDAELTRLARRRRLGVVLPALYSEFERPAVHDILNELRRVQWLGRVVLVLSQAGRAQYEQVCRLFEGFRAETTVLWREAPETQEMLEEINSAGLAAAIPGKGRACWIGVGYLLARGDCDVMAFQDCDIKTYHRRMLARLVYPLMAPRLGFEFAKAYYPRFTRKMNGRLTRMMLGPLVEVLEDAGLGEGFVRFLGGFRYVLSGEIAMSAELARKLEVSPDWGLEISTLESVYRRVPAGRVCQVDVSECYDHKHQDVSAGDPNGGLHRMAREVALAVYRGVAGEGKALGRELLRATVPLAYRRAAAAMAERYAGDAEINGLEYSLHDELASVDVFARALEEAAAQFEERPGGVAALPSWARVESALPEVYDRMLGAGRSLELVEEATA